MVTAQRPTAGALYDRDYAAWAWGQAMHLKAGDVAALDRDHLAEEIEALRSDRLVAAESALTRVLEPLLKLRHAPAQDPRAGWRRSATAHRLTLQRILRRSPSIAARIDLAGVYADAKLLAGQSLQDFDGLDPAALPATCPFTLAQALDTGWWPQPQTDG